MKKSIFTYLIVFVMFLMSGCASVSTKKTVNANKPTTAPRPVCLTDIPDYGKDKSVNADKSAGCFLLPCSRSINTQVAAEFQSLFQDGLRRRGYEVIDNYNTAEARVRIQKQLQLVDYSTRSCYLPVHKKTATDIHMVVKIQNRPLNTGDTFKPRYFSVVAREISESPSSNSVLLNSAIDKNFCLDAFCHALGSADE